jgi:hypothetical protein
MTRIRFGLLLAAVLVMVGCTRNKTPSKVYGTVTYKKQPVKAGSVTFHSKDQGSYTGTLNEQGGYEIPDMPAGEMTVTVETEYLNPNKKAPVYGGKRAGVSQDERSKAGYGPPGGRVDETTRYVKIPKKYADPDTSDLKVTIETGRQQKDFDLND